MAKKKSSKKKSSGHVASLRKTYQAAKSAYKAAGRALGRATGVSK